MRELKFRAWIERYKKYMPVAMIHFEPILGKIDYIEVVATGGDWAKFYPEEFILEQYTGLKDKNGKEIYEGDIVEYTTCYYGNEKRYRKVVEWEEWYSDDFGEPHNLGYRDLDEGEDVIGNIHENPELLEEVRGER